MANFDAPSGAVDGGIFASGTADVGYAIIPGAYERQSVPILGGTVLDGTNPPTIGAWVTGVQGYNFATGADDLVHGTVVLPNTYDEGTDIVLEVLWGSATTTASGTVLWAVDYSIIHSDGTVSPAKATILSDLYTFSANLQNKALRSTFASDITGTSLDVGDAIAFTFYRDVSGDDYADSVYAFSLDFIFRTNSNGAAAATSPKGF